LWNRTYGGTSDDWAEALVQSGEGGYTTAGRTASFGAGNYDCWLVETRLTLTGDINGDGKIDMKDIGTVAIHFGEHLP
jgi:hypothetical protein